MGTAVSGRQIIFIDVYCFANFLLVTTVIKRNSDGSSSRYGQAGKKLKSEKKLLKFIIPISTFKICKI